MKKLYIYLSAAVIAVFMFPVLAFSAPGAPIVHAEKPPIVLAAASSRVFVFDPRRLRWYAYENGRLVKSGKASGGAGYCKDVKRACRTPRGTFTVSHKGGANCRSSRYPLGKGGARMDYCIFFSKYYAIHGSSNVPNYNASHGCIRVLPSAAKWLNRSFLVPGSKVIVKPY